MKTFLSWDRTGNEVQCRSTCSIGWRSCVNFRLMIIIFSIFPHLTLYIFWIPYACRSMTLRSCRTCLILWCITGRDWSVFLKSLFLGCLAKCSSILVVRVFLGNRCIWLIYEWNFCCKKGMFRKWLRCFFSRWNRALNVSIDIHYANSSLSWFRIMKIEERRISHSSFDLL